MIPGIASSKAQTLVANDEFDCCIPSTEVAIAFAATVEQLWQQASELLDLRQYTEAIAVFDQILELKPDSFLAWYWRGNSLASVGQYENAIASYDEALKIKPNYLSAWFERKVLLIFRVIAQLGRVDTFKT